MTIRYQGAFFSRTTNLTPAIARAARETRDYVLPVLKAKTPVRSGTLQKAWNIDLSGYSFKISNNTPYAAFVEFGTKRMRARRMLSSTVPEMTYLFREHLISEVGKNLTDKVLGKPGRAPQVSLRNVYTGYRR